MDDEEYDPFEAVDDDDERAGSDAVGPTSQAGQQHCAAVGEQLGEYAAQHASRVLSPHLDEKSLPEGLGQDHGEAAMQSDMDVSSEEGVGQREPALLHSQARVDNDDNGAKTSQVDDMDEAGGGLNAGDSGLDAADVMYWSDSRDKEVVQRSKVPDSAAYEVEDGGSLANHVSTDNSDRRDKGSSRDRKHRAKRPRSRGLDKLGTLRPRSDEQASAKHDRRHRHGKPTQVPGVDRETSQTPRKRSDRAQRRRRERSGRPVALPTLSTLNGDSGNDYHERSPIPLPNGLEQESPLQANNGTANPPEGAECDGLGEDSPAALDAVTPGQVEGHGSDGLLPEQNAKIKVSLSREQKHFLAKAKKVVDKVLMKYDEKNRVGTKEDFEKLSRRLSFKILSKEHGNTKMTAETPKKIVKYVHAWFEKFGTYEAAKMSIQTDQSTF